MQFFPVKCQSPEGSFDPTANCLYEVLKTYSCSTPIWCILCKLLFNTCPKHSESNFHTSDHWPINAVIINFFWFPYHRSFLNWHSNHFAKSVLSIRYYTAILNCYAPKTTISYSLLRGVILTKIGQSVCNELLVPLAVANCKIYCSADIAYFMVKAM